MNKPEQKREPVQPPADFFHFAHVIRAPPPRFLLCMAVQDRQDGIGAHDCLGAVQGIQIKHCIELVVRGLEQWSSTLR